MLGYVHRTTWSYRGIVCLSVLAAMALMAVGEGNPLYALLPIAMGLGAVALWRLPMRYLAHALVFVGLLVDNPTERPGQGLYKSPLYFLGSVFYQPLSHALNLPGCKFTGMELMIGVLCSIMGLRLLVADPVDGRFRLQAAAPLLRACVVAIVTLVVMEIYGIARGGSVNHSILQMRTMILMPCLTMFFAYAFKSRRDPRALLRTFITVGILRAFLCFYYYITFMRFQPHSAGQSGDGSYVTTHSDSILAAVVVVIGLVTVYQRPTLRALMKAAAFVPIIGLGIVLNNRRIAFVAVAMGFFFSYLAANKYFRRRVHATILTLLPFMFLYMAAGWNAKGGWAKPVQSLKSVVQQKDTSSATRDIENYNLLETFKKNPIVGSGFGHQYLELVHAFDISAIFEAYRYVPHNSILWFWGAGGFIGFTLYWMFLVVGVFMAARVCRFAENNEQVVVAMTSLSAVIAYGSQCFGDMGLMSWMGSLIVSASLGLCASLATRVGAWTNEPPHSAPAPAPQALAGNFP